MFFTGDTVNIGQFFRENTETLVQVGDNGDYVENTKKNFPKDGGKQILERCGAVTENEQVENIPCMDDLERRRILYYYVTTMSQAARPRLRRWSRMKSQRVSGSTSGRDMNNFFRVKFTLSFLPFYNSLFYFSSYATIAIYPLSPSLAVVYYDLFLI